MRFSRSKTPEFSIALHILVTIIQLSIHRPASAMDGLTWFAFVTIFASLCVSATRIILFSLSIPKFKKILCVQNAANIHPPHKNIFGFITKVVHHKADETEMKDSNIASQSTLFKSEPQPQLSAWTSSNDTLEMKEKNGLYFL
jgi:hypothetical protein